MDNLYLKVARRRRHGEGGFTLIELLVVIAVLAVLAFIVIFNVTGVKNKGNAAACATDVKSVQSGVDSYMNDNPAVADPFVADLGAFPATGGAWTLIVPNYLHTIPTITGTNNECTTTAMALHYANGTDSTNGYTVVGK
jgi:prepilin-type N-terminal cleavage/methylation domain-containing protein